jgi:hypothetical protein
MLNLYIHNYTTKHNSPNKINLSADIKYFKWEKILLYLKYRSPLQELNNPMKKFFAVLIFISFVFMIYINYKSGTGQINQITAGEVSAKYPTLFTPAGYTFSIWGLIYLLGLIFVVRLIRNLFYQDGTSGTVIVSGYYVLSCLLNISWIYAWHYDYIILSQFLMTGLLIILLLLYQRVSQKQYSSIWGYLSTCTPISIYLSWITIATVANTSVMLISIGWSGSPLNESFWASIMIIVAAGINLVILISKRDIFFALVFLWAAYGIIIARSESDLDSVVWIIRAALAGMIIVFLGILFARFVKVDKTAGS